MPLSPLQRSILAAYDAACDQVPRHLRQSLILIGGAATIAHGGASRVTEDLDVLGDARTLAHLDDAANNGQGGFHKDSSGIIRWDARLAQPDFTWFVEVELVEVGGWAVRRCPEAVGFRKGCVATLPELVRLRCETVLERGKPVDYTDLRLLLEMTHRKALKLPSIDDEEETEILVKAVEAVWKELGDENILIFFCNILTSFVSGGRRWGSFLEFVHTIPTYVLSTVFIIDRIIASIQCSHF